MMRLAGSLFLLLNAVVISAVAIYVSIYGMIALFAAHAIVVGIMIGSIEVGKLSAATWLKFNWSNPSMGWMHRAYLLTAIIVISIITAIGCFGFLSAGHLEQNAPLAGLGIEMQQYQVVLDQTNQANRRIEDRLKQIDANVNVFLTSGSGTRGLNASNSLQKERDKLSSELAANNTKINELNEKLAPIRQKSTEVEAKLGPVKYLATALGSDDPSSAVNIVILLIMLAFDPLAVILILSAMISLRDWNEERKGIVAVSEPIAEMADDEIVISEQLSESSSDPYEVYSLEDTDAADLDVELDSPIFTGDYSQDIEQDVASTLYQNESDELEQIDQIEQIESPVIESTPEPKRQLTNDDLIDLLEQHPSLITDLIDVVKNINLTTVSDLTGARVE